MKILERTGMPRATEFSITDPQALLEVAGSAEVLLGTDCSGSDP